MAALMARLAATGEEETEDEEMEEEEEEEDRREDRNPSNSSARATEDDSKSEDGEDDSKSEDGEDDSASAPPRVSLSSTRTAPPAIPPSVAFEVSSGADPPLSGSAVNDVPSAPVADEDSDGAFAATRIAHLRGQCTPSSACVGSRAYRIVSAPPSPAPRTTKKRGEDEGQETRAWRRSRCRDPRRRRELGGARMRAAARDAGDAEEVRAANAGSDAPRGPEAGARRRTCRGDDVDRDQTMYRARARRELIPPRGYYYCINTMLRVT